MRIRGHQEMSVAPDQLLLNGNVLLTESLSRSNNHHPRLIPQYGFPFPIHPNVADGYHIPVLPNLNYLPEKTASTGIGDVMCSPSTPVPLDKNKRIQDRLPWEVIDLVDEIETNGSIQRNEIGMLQPSAEMPMGLYFSKPVMSSQIVSSLPQEVSSLPQEGEMNVAMPSEGVSLQQLDTEGHGRRENQYIDLNKTPQQKPRRKKHRPKVIREGKPARTPKPVTPKPVTPKPARNKESSSGKRKYVRKKKVDSSDTVLYPLSDIVEPDSGSGTKSVRRCLNFDSEEPQARDGHPGSSLMFARNAEVQAQDACISGTITGSSIKSAMSSVQGQEVVAENSPEGITLKINRITSQIPNEYIRIPETPTQPAQPSRRETMRLDHALKGYVGVGKNPPPPPQPSRREIIQENLKAFARKHHYMNMAANSDKSLQTGQTNHLVSDNIQDVLLRGTKRHHNHFDEDHVSTLLNFSHAYSRIDHISEIHDTSRHGPYFPQIHKKKRTEKQNELTSNASSVTCIPSSRREQSLVRPNNCEVLTSTDAQRPMSSSWKTSMVVPNNCEVFTFADAQRIMALEKLRASEHMLSFAQRSIQTNKILKEPVRANNITSPSVAKDCNNLSYPVKSYSSNDMNCSQLSTIEKVSRCNASQGSKICGPQTCIEAPAVNNHAKMKSKSCTEKEQIRLVKPMSSNTKQMVLQEHEAASCSYGSSLGQKSAQVTASASRNYKDKNMRLPVSSLQDCQSSNNFKESLCGNSLSGAIVPYGDPVDDIVRKLKCLNINGGHVIVRAEPHNALVPYGGGGGTVVPYEGPFDPIKKRRPRPKVDLDPESNRVWKVLMGKESSDEATDMNKEKWWEEERRIVRGRVDSFIARMHLVQGDRRFSRWKGSVVDSVVGVFLTQNVSDHLSSSAFMALAARFPARQKGDICKVNAEKMSGFTEQASIKWKEKMLGQELCPRGPFMIPDAEHMAEKEIANSSEAVGSNTDGSVVGYSKGIGLNVHRRELEIDHGSHDNRTDTSVTVTGSTSVAEAEDRMSMEDVVSSQNSVVSSQNSSEYLVKTSEQIKLSSLSNLDGEDFINAGMCNGLDSSSSFMELLQMAETTRFQELYSHGNGRINLTEYCSAVDQFPYLEVDKRTPISDLKGKDPSMYRSNSHPHDRRHDFMCAPSPSSHLQNSLNSSLTAMGNVNVVRVESSSHVPSSVSGVNIINNVETLSRSCRPSEVRSSEAMGQNNFTSVPYAPSPSHHLHNWYSRLTAMGKVNTVREEISSHLPSTASGMNTTNNIKMVGRRHGPSVENSTEAIGQHDFIGVSSAPPPSFRHHNFSNSRLMALGDVNAEREESSSQLPSTASGINATDEVKIMDRRCHPLVENINEVVGPQRSLCTSRTAPVLDKYAPTSKHSVQPLACSETEVRVDKHSCCHGNLQKDITASSGKNTPHKCSQLQGEQTVKFQQKERGVEFQVKNIEHAVRAQAQLHSGRIHQTFSNSQNNLRETFEVVEAVESNLKDVAYSSQNASVATTANSGSKAKKVKAENEKKKTYDWDNLRKQACSNGAKREKSSDAMDSLDWEAIRCADVNEISQTIRERGMNNMLAERIKEFLNRLVKDHGSIDLEWLRDVPPDSAKDYLLSIRGLGLKSVECVRLLTLHHLAFPVDTNVGRICVRLGWVPLQPLPESLQLHLLEMYPVLETIQKYLWPRLCKLDQRTLYELHYQLITFGKVFCTKSKPNCNACPMRGECKHFASAFASARLALPGPEEKGLVNSTIPISCETRHTPVLNPMHLPRLEGSTFSQGAVVKSCDPIIEEPATPEPETIEISESAIEDAFYEDPDEIPTIKLNLEEFTQNLQNYMQENNMELQDGDMSKALVAISPEAASIPIPKLKNVSRLRTEHQVYELPDSHPLLEGLDQREPDDPCSYLLAIWSPGETAQSIEPPTVCCDSQDTGKLCDKMACFACNSIREAQSQTVRGTLLIPCRTAMRGSFPLNGTYFQVNEVFADHDSSLTPIAVSRQCIWNLPRRTVYFGTSIPSIFKGLTTEGIQHCFWRGFVCVRGFDRTTRAPRPLYARLHFPASKVTRNKKTAAAAAGTAATTAAAAVATTAAAAAAAATTTAATAAAAAAAAAARGEE